MRHLDELESRRLLASFSASSVAELVNDINAANAAGGSNTITLAAGITFNLTSGLPVVAAGNDLTFFGNGDTIQRSTARGTPWFGLFTVAAGASLSLNNVTLSGGVAGAGGGIYSNGVLNITDSTIRNNQAIGVDGLLVGGLVPQPGSPAYGGGLYVAGGTATLTNTTVSSNLARGGNGADGKMLGKDAFGGPTTGAGMGGDAFGGGIYVAPNAAVTLCGTTVTGNSATGGSGGNAPQGHKAPAGAGRGGGIYIDSGASVGLDAFTQAHTTGNTASTSNNDIFGSFTIL